MNKRSLSLSSMMMSEWKELASLYFIVSSFSLYVCVCECVLARTAVIMRMRADISVYVLWWWWRAQIEFDFDALTCSHVRDPHSHIYTGEEKEDDDEQRERRKLAEHSIERSVKKSKQIYIDVFGIDIWRFSSYSTLHHRWERKANDMDKFLTSKSRSIL
jgi:hypothetical protein